LLKGDCFVANAPRNDRMLANEPRNDWTVSLRAKHIGPRVRWISSSSAIYIWQ